MKRILGGIGIAVTLTLLVSCSSSSSSSGGSSGPTTITMWEGYTGVEGTAFQALVKKYNASQSAIHVNVLEVDNDYSLQKVSTAVRGGEPPDIAYLYGSWAPNVAKIPMVVPLNSVVSQSDVNWQDFFPGERAVATVGSTVIGMPALVDNLAVVYNKKLFAAAHLAPPSPNWTWDELRADAAKLTNASTKTYGMSFPADGTENTVWQYEAMLWEAGGDILNSSNTAAAFDSPAGIRALTQIGDMANQDHSLYLDTTGTGYTNLFNSGHIGMLLTGPWDLETFTTNYGVQQMPSFPGSSAGHITISGPDNWVVFNNGSARTAAAEKFLLWLTSPAEVTAFSLATGDLPTRASVASQASVVSAMNKHQPGLSVFIGNLHNVTKARPQLPCYPTISTALGTAIVSVELGKATPAQALQTAATSTNATLATCSTK